MNLFEASILKYIHNLLSCTFFDVFFKTISCLGDKGYIWIFLALLLICFKKTRKCGIHIAVSLVMCLLFGNLILKPLIARTRPFDIISDFNIIIPKPSDFSFPSGHTLASFASATAVFKNFKKSGTAAYVLAVLIAFSRIYLCVHYPSDILGGIVLGMIFGTVSHKLCEKYIPKGTVQ